MLLPGRSLSFVPLSLLNVLMGLISLANTLALRLRKEGVRQNFGLPFTEEDCLVEHRPALICRTFH